MRKIIYFYYCNDDSNICLLYIIILKWAKYKTELFETHQTSKNRIHMICIQIRFKDTIFHTYVKFVTHFIYFCILFFCLKNYTFSRKLQILLLQNIDNMLVVRCIEKVGRRFSIISDTSITFPFSSTFRYSMTHLHKAIIGLLLCMF